MYPEPASRFLLTPLNTRIFSSQSKRNFGLGGGSTCTRYQLPYPISASGSAHRKDDDHQPGEIRRRPHTRSAKTLNKMPDSSIYRAPREPTCNIGIECSAQ